MSAQSPALRSQNGSTNPPGRADDRRTPSDSPHSAVLLVTRDRSLDESCRSSLSEAGIDVVVSVPNSKRAMELLGTNELFDAVVIGVGPGDVEAVMLAQHMRRHRSDTPTVVVSPIRDLRIPGAPTECETARGTDASKQPDIFRRTIRKAVALRRSMRLRRAP